MKKLKDHKVEVMENARYAGSSVRYVAHRNRVTRQQRHGDIWADDPAWTDPKGRPRDLADSERRAKSYATIEAYSATQKESPGCTTTSSSTSTP
jgi:hypothetical protein